MFCPNCAAQNLEGASFCRVCGANISLIPQALSGELPEAVSDDSRSSRRRKRGREVEPSIEKGIVNIFAGLGFIIAALAIMLKFPGGIFWGWTLFMPGFSTLGRGVASIASAKRKEADRLTAPGGTGAYLSNRASSSEPARLGLPNVRRTGELQNPVPSVTEGTTRHLGAESPTRHFDE